MRVCVCAGVIAHRAGVAERAVYIAKNVQFYWSIENANVYTLLILFPIFTALAWIRTCVLVLALWSHFLSRCPCRALLAAWLVLSGGLC